MAITHSLPISKWYFEVTSICGNKYKATSEWTLDYPPFFAYFEYILGVFAPAFDAKMLIITKEEYRSVETIFFQRISVILTDIVFIFAVYKYVRSDSSLSSMKARISTFAILICNVGLLFVDRKNVNIILNSQFVDIHFQYNGMLMGYVSLGTQ